MRPRSLSLGGFLDAASDCAVLAFTVWTMIAYGGMATHAPVDVLTFIWVATLPVLVWLRIVLARRRGDAGGLLLERDAPPIAWAPWSVVLAVATAIGAGVAAGTRAPWALVWVLALISIGTTVAVLYRRALSEEAAYVAAGSGHVFAALTSLGLGVGSLFLTRGNADDVFYVGRATAVAELNHIPVRDVIFTAEEVKRAGGTGLPTDSYSALQGAVGQLLHVHPASIAYFAMPVLVTFLATWALWRLLRSWAARWTALCFALGVVYWIWSAQAQLMPGNFFLSRIWQGKVAFTAWLVATMYVYLTRWVRGGDLLTALLVVATGIAAIGMTSSATFIAPLIFAAAAVPLLVRRAWRRLALVLAAATVPLVIGLAASRRFPLPESRDQLHEPAAWYFKAMFGAGVLAFIGLVALLAAPWLVRRGSAAGVTVGIACVVVFLVAPGVITGIDGLFGLHAPGALRRTLWVAPLPVLVGLLAATPLSDGLARAGLRFEAIGRLPQALLVALPACVVAGLLIGFGNPLWISSINGRSYIQSKPTWRVDSQTLAATRAILARYDGEGPILASGDVMDVMPIVTVEPKAVDARAYYLRRTRLSRDGILQRAVLTRFAKRQPPNPSDEEIRSALSGLDVGLVCLNRGWSEEIARLERIAPYHPAFVTNGYACLTRGTA
jgi:hypothetical protein